MNNIPLPSVTVAYNFKGKGNPAQLQWRLEQKWSINRLFQHVINGYAFAVGEYKGDKTPTRRKGDFKRGWIIGLDFDDLTPEKALQLVSEAFVRDYAAFTYTTPSHTPNAPRLRIVFVLDRAIEGVAEYEKAVAKLLTLFAQYNPDTACKDAARLFFGNPSPDPAFTKCLENVLPVDEISSLPDEKPVAARFPRIPNQSALDNGDLPREFIEAIERSIRFTGRKHAEFLECHCPIHPPDDTPSAAWHPEKHFLWCYHESQHYLAKDVGAQFGIELRDYLPNQEQPKRSYALPELPEQSNTNPLRLDEPFPSLETEVIAGFAAHNEYGDAKLLMLLISKRIVYDRSQKAWYWWNGNWWIKDEKGKTPELLYKPVGEAYAVAAGETATHLAKLEAELEINKSKTELIAQITRIKAVAKDLASRPRALRTHARAYNVLQIASGLSSLVGNEWDSDPMLLGVKNGIVDLQTGEIRQGRQPEFIRKVAPVDYSPNAQAPRWIEFIDQIFDGNQALVSFIQRLLGYSITGITSDHILPVFYGRGRNGKDTLIETVGHVLGDYAYSGTSDLLIEQHQYGQATPHLYDLMGRRLVWVTETGEGARLNVNQVKYITGAGRITARPLYGGFVEFQATHHVILFTNHKPRVPSQNEDYAIWKRLLLIPLKLSFVDNPFATNERRRDPRLKQKLLQESPGILNWLVSGCLAWQEQGLNPPQTVLEATEEYARSEDIVAEFVEECCALHSEAREKASTLYEAYKEWAKRNGYPDIGGKRFGERLTAQFPKERAHYGMVYIGVQLRITNE
jgi:putative DNA primase/helicase